MNQQKTILFITHYAEMYGANQSMLQLILELRNNFKIKPIVLLPRNGAICEIFDKENIPYKVSHFYWWVNEDRGIIQFLMNLRKQKINYFKVKKYALLFDERIDLIYSNSITINIGFFLKKHLKIPHIWHIRESIEQFDFKLTLGHYLSKKLLKNGADRYILISDYLCGYYHGLLPQEKVLKVYNGIDFSISCNRLENKDKILHLCMVGLLSEQKNNFEAIEAIHILKSKYKFDTVRLHLIGRSKEGYMELLNEYILANKLENLIEFHGHKSNVHELLDTMQIGLMCSRDEAFGRVSVEYMLHSMPVIASISGANTEIVKEGINGYLYDIYNAEELADNIYRFIEKPELLESIGKMAYNYAKINFSSEKNTREIYEIINQLITK